MTKSLAIFASLFVTVSAQAVIIASDNANNLPYANGWQTGDNGGFGFDAWSLLATTTNPANAGHFIGTSTLNAQGANPGNIDVFGSAFGMYANSTQGSVANRTFIAPNLVGDVFRFEFDNGWIDNGARVEAGFVGGGNAVGIVRFVGGQNDYKIIDGSNVISTGLAFTGRGLTVETTLTGATTYTTVVTRKEGGSFTHNGTRIGSLNQFTFVNENAGAGINHDAFVNSLEIESVPEPITMTILAAGAALLAKKRRKS
ncbi:MAG: hypothetical protein MUC92_11450 [Fimbriimonadaceae bacterium]|jgi:hypothetical protein|nr:hypothetical protein [Fimbriimonadaceae bacterium]